MKKRYSIWDEIQRMHEQMDALFENFFTDHSFNERSNNLLPSYTRGESALTTRDNYREPLSNLHETDKEFIMTLELPGVDKKDIQLNTTEDGVEIKVEHKEEDKKDSKDGSYSFTTYSNFYKYFPLPEGIKVDDIKASYKNGVLELKIPKTHTKKKVKKINLE